MAQYLPFRYFQVKRPHVFTVLRPRLLLFDPGPQLFIAIGAQLQALKGLSTPQEGDILRTFNVAEFMPGSFNQLAQRVDRRWNGEGVKDQREPAV